MATTDGPEMPDFRVILSVSKPQPSRPPRTGRVPEVVNLTATAKSLDLVPF